MSTIQVLLADPQPLAREGLRCILTSLRNIKVIGEATTRKEVMDKVQELEPDVITIDCNLPNFITSQDLPVIKNLSPLTKIMVVTTPQNKQKTLETIELGINSYILKECSREEIVDATHAAKEDKNYYCGKVLDEILDKDTESHNLMENIEENCEPVELSDREIDVVKLIAQEYTNKEIAEELFISPHTVTTHRKNIMKKLDLRNTAGIVLYAIETGLVHPSTS